MSGPHCTALHGSPEEVCAICRHPPRSIRRFERGPNLDEVLRLWGAEKFLLYGETGHDSYMTFEVGAVWGFAEENHELLLSSRGGTLRPIGVRCRVENTICSRSDPADLRELLKLRPTQEHVLPQLRRLRWHRTIHHVGHRCRRWHQQHQHQRQQRRAANDP